MSGKNNPAADNNALAEITALEKEIRDYLGIDDNNLSFDYNDFEGKVRLDLVTTNPTHNQSFLFHTTIGTGKADALEKMIEYIKKTRDEENSYTIHWMDNVNKELQTSYFRAKNMLRALDKLYYSRDMNTITVYIITLNPIS
jgi:hypothetical protein